MAYKDLPWTIYNFVTTPWYLVSYRFSKMFSWDSRRKNHVDGLPVKTFLLSLSLKVTLRSTIPLPYSRQIPLSVVSLFLPRRYSVGTEAMIRPLCELKKN